MNLLLLDDHPLFCEGFAHALSHADPGTQVRTAHTLEQALEHAAAKPAPDIVLIDHRLGAGSGFDAMREFGLRHPLVARVMISGDEDPILIARARDAGASGFLGKSLSIDRVLAALQALSRGEVVFETGCECEPATLVYPTARQMEVLTLLAQGQPNKRIANELGISERTVKLHVTALLELLQARNRTHLLVRAREQGVL
jgi:DNA-binding NarL/FixJ family response regulator